MIELDEATRQAITDLLNRIRTSDAKPDPAERVVLLANAVGIAPNDPVFRVFLLQVATASAAHDATAALAAAAATLERRARKLSEQSERTRYGLEPTALLRKCGWMLAGLAAACLFVGVTLGAVGSLWLAASGRAHPGVPDTTSLERSGRVLPPGDRKVILPLLQNDEAARLPDCAGAVWSERDGLCLHKAGSGPRADRVVGWRTLL